MAQKAKVIEITQTFVPVDPNAYPDNRGFTQQDDYPFKEPIVSAYEGYNFMPTPYGYKSYFGTNASLQASALTSNIDKIFIIQTETYANLLVALCDDGIWTKQGEEAGDWTQNIALDIPSEGQHLAWSHCTIGTETFMYRATGDNLYLLSANAIPYEADSFAGIDSPTLVATAGNSNYLAGSYSASVAWQNSDGAWSAPGTSTTITIAADNCVDIRIPRNAAATAYRIYIQTGTYSFYLEYPQNASATISTPDLGPNSIDVRTNITLPDTTWLPLNKVAPYVIQTLTPSFLNMAGQQGIFKAGVRLGFWDTEGSIAWSSIDDYTDFEPSLTTLAGNAIFSDVVGRITNILSHGDGFIIYSAKSIVWVRQAAESTFKWDPKVLLSGAGVAFAEEVTAAFPDTLQFAYTSIGLYRIQDGKEELIVPEVVDYLKEMQDPVMLRVLNGRYLCLQVIDPLYIDGLIQASIDSIPARTYTFPDSLSVEDLEVDPEVAQTPTEFCYTSEALTTGSTEEQAAAAEAARVAEAKPPKKSGSSYQPVFTAYFSSANAVDPENIVWTSTPCATVGPDGVEYNLSPGSLGTLANIGPDLTGKIAMTGTHWNIDTFVATQIAIWQFGDKKRQAYLNAVINKAATAYGPPTVTTAATVPPSLPNQLVCPTPTPVTDDCALGGFISAFSDPHYGLNACSFWLTRYAIEVATITRRKVTSTECDRSVGAVMYSDYSNPTPTYSTIEELVSVTMQALVASSPTIYSGAYKLSYYDPAAEIFNGWYATLLVYRIDWGSYSSHMVIRRQQSVTRTTRSSMNAYNTVTDRQSGVFGVDRGWLEQVGWTYTDVNGATQTLSAQATCVLPTDPVTPPAPSTTILPELAGLPIDPETGSICGTPYTPVLIEEVDSDPLEWTDLTQTVTIPSGNFLLQAGSIGPIYPTYPGALVYDMQLKRWGKMKLDYKVLLDYSPVNSISGGVVPYETFGMEAGCMKADGLVYLFDQWPENSYIKYGKIGYNRLGMTDMEEVRVNFRGPCTGTLKTETSLNGRDAEIALSQLRPFTDATQVVEGFNVSGRWHSIVVDGQYDIVNIEFRGLNAGRR